MKKIFILFLLLVSVCMALGPDAMKQIPNERWWSDSATNPLFMWIQEADRYIEAGAAIGTGNIYYVDSNVTTAGNGNTWDTALATLDEAIAKCTDNNGDVIYVAQGHSETWSTDAALDNDSVDVDVIGVAIIGCGTGTDMPKFIYADVDNEFVIGAANTYIYNLAFQSSITGVTHAVEIEADADGSVIDSCWFMDGEASGTDEFTDAIQWTAASDNITVKNCQFESYGGAGANTACDLTAGVEKDTRIINCHFDGDYAEAPIYSDDIDLRQVIVGNILRNTNSGEYAIEYTTTATGMISDNHVYTDAIATAIDPGSCTCLENYAMNTTDLSAILVPALPALSAQTKTAGSWEDILNKLYYASDGTGAYPATLANDSCLAMIMAKGATATPSTFNNTTDSLEAISDLVTTADAAVDTGYAIQEKAISKTITTIANGANNLFAVSGGPIKILDIVTYVTTTAIGAEGCLVGYNVDPTTPATDTAFGTDGTALECNNAAVGTALIWDGVLAADLTTAVNGAFVGMGRDVADGLIVPIGMIELTAAHDGTITGEFTVYMRYMPLSPLSVVTAQ